MGGFQNPGVCLQAFPSFLPLHSSPCNSLLPNCTETLATQARNKAAECAVYIANTKTLQRIGVKIIMLVGRPYPSLSFSRLAIDLVKPVKQVSIQWVFPGGWLIGWKVATNSVLYLKQKASRFVISPSVTQDFFSNEQITLPSYIAQVQALTQGPSHHHWCVPRPAKQPEKRNIKKSR